MFQEQRENDEAQILDSPYGVDLNSHVDVFYAILRQVRSRINNTKPTISHVRVVNLPDYRALEFDKFEYF